MTDEPWDSYDRGALWSGWSYPVGRTVVEASLRAAGVHLLSLDFIGHGGATADPLLLRADPLLLRADRYRDLGNTYFRPRGTPDLSRCVLAIHAVPRAARAEAHAALTSGGALDRASAWLASTASADPTWLYTSHSWTAVLRDGALHEVEADD